MSTNLFTASGTLAKHDLRYTPKGTAVLEVTLVGKRPIGDSYVFSRADLTFFGKQAETLAEALQEGMAYQATGRLEYESWETDGARSSRLRVIGEQMFRLEHADVRQEEKGPLLYGAENRVILTGGLTADPDIRQTAQKTPVVGARMGFSSWDKENATAKNHYIELEGWREVATQFAGLQKGAQLLVEGSLKLESWEDKETNTRRYKRVLEVQRVVKLSRIKATEPAEFPEELPTPTKSKKTRAA